MDPLEEVECPELLKSQGESCWDSKQLVTLADLGNWTGTHSEHVFIRFIKCSTFDAMKESKLKIFHTILADLSPERTETSNNTPEDKPTTSLKQKIKR